MTETLGEALPREQARCRELLQLYVEIGPAGAFAAACLRQSLAAADRAAISGDIVEMIRAYKDLEGYE